MSDRELDAIVSDLLTTVIERAEAALAEKGELLAIVAPHEVGNLALGLAAWALNQAAPSWLPAIGRPAPPAGELIPIRDRMAMAILAVRASETRHCIREARADMAALRRMGRVA